MVASRFNPPWSEVPQVRPLVQLARSDRKSPQYIQGTTHAPVHLFGLTPHALLHPLVRPSWTLSISRGSSSASFLRRSLYRMEEATISPKTCVWLTPFLHLNVSSSRFQPRFSSPVCTQFEEYHAQGITVPPPKRPAAPASGSTTISNRTGRGSMKCDESLSTTLDL